MCAYCPPLHYQDEEGAKECHLCNDTEYCPLGSPTNGTSSIPPRCPPALFSFLLVSLFVLLIHIKKYIRLNWRMKILWRPSLLRLLSTSPSRKLLLCMLFFIFPSSLFPPSSLPPLPLPMSSFPFPHFNC